LEDSEDYYQIGRKVAYFGNGYQKRIERFGRKMWWIPILGGEFILDRRLGYSEGLMGGNLWFFGKDTDSALNAAEKGVEAIAPMPGVVTTFPGGIAGSGSKAGSRYDFTIASTYEKFCPMLQQNPDVEHGLPEGVASVMEIIMNGRNIEAIINATQAAISASKDTEGLMMISAGNYGGKLGKSLIYLHPNKQPT
ncbi:MAG: hypothetical protein OXC62_14110, partial [Aestuariivita sp.]|nr:hypothetical protein [Aestuariivita sp.]